MTGITPSRRALLAGLATTPLLARGLAGQSHVYSQPARADADGFLTAARDMRPGGSVRATCPAV